MTLLERLQSHKGSLVHLKTELFWYGRGWDGNPGRLCLLLDDTTATASGGFVFEATTGAAANASWARDTAGALLLIEGSPRWIWMAEKDVEVL